MAEHVENSSLAVAQFCRTVGLLTICGYRNVVPRDLENAVRQNLIPDCKKPLETRQVGFVESSGMGRVVRLQRNVGLICKQGLD